MIIEIKNGNIIKEAMNALTLIKEICEDNICEDCIFGNSNSRCMIRENTPDVWDIDIKTSVRVLK